MKKIFFTFVLTCLILSNVFGQDRKHNVYLNLYALFYGIFTGNGPGIGIGYDYNINQDFAVGAYGQFYSFFNDNNTTFDLIVNGKYYPIKTEIGNPYINAGLGIRRNHKDGENFYGLIVPVYFGWKYIFQNGLFLDPALGVRYNAASFMGAYENHSFITAVRASIGWVF